jgi:hypothetical protein
VLVPTTRLLLLFLSVVSRGVILDFPIEKIDSTALVFYGGFIELLLLLILLSSIFTFLFSVDNLSISRKLLHIEYININIHIKNINLKCI